MSECEVCDADCRIRPGLTMSCGDGAVNLPFETCDDGNTLTEACPYGLSNYTCLICDADCQRLQINAPYCGDQIIQGEEGEVCDSGLPINLRCPYNQENCTVCNEDCQEVAGLTSRCGDGVIDEGLEGCDDGNTETESCYGARGSTCSVCDAGCQPRTLTATYCGDGELQSLFETCDDGNTDRSDGCDDLCRIEECGNGVIQQWGGEECDDGNSDPLDGCDLCHLTCGDGSLGLNEECDDRNLDDGDGCDAQCRLEFCGNGLVQEGAGEECDDGNLANADGCDSECRPKVCGNGVRQAGERCDDGNLFFGDGCDALCQLECGNGFRDASEECDDGNQSPGDGCDSECLAEECGNGRLDNGEACDDGNLINGDGCDEECARDTCGDGLIQTHLGEECEDGNDQAGDGCHLCLVEYCGNGRRDIGEACDSTEAGCNDSCQLKPCAEVGCPDIDWILIEGGPIQIGKPIGELDPHSGFAWESALTPQRDYYIRGFYMAKTEVTIGQMRACIDRGPCESWDAGTDRSQRVSWADRLQEGESYAVRGVPYQVMTAYAEWVGGRLPSELEWEFAARSRGVNEDFPWGAELQPIEETSCLANTHACGLDDPSLPCSYFFDRTNQGLCDMVGNLFEMTQSEWRVGYDHYDHLGQTSVSQGGSRVAKGLSYYQIKGGYQEDL